MQQDNAYRVVGVRKGGEQVLISKHATREGVDTALKLIKNCNGYAFLQIEDAQGLKRFVWGPLRRAS